MMFKIKWHGRIKAKTVTADLHYDASSLYLAETLKEVVLSFVKEIKLGPFSWFLFGPADLSEVTSMKWVGVPQPEVQPSLLEKHDEWETSFCWSCHKDIVRKE